MWAARYARNSERMRYYEMDARLKDLGIAVPPALRIEAAGVSGAVRGIYDLANQVRTAQPVAEHIGEEVTSRLPFRMVDMGAVGVEPDPAAWEPGTDRKIDSLAASLTVALAALEDGAEADALWAAANLEEDWQAELWGEDLLAKERRDRRAAEFAGAHAFARLAQAADG